MLQYTDSAHLSRALARAAGGLQNPFTGLGSARDPLSYTKIGGAAEVSDLELSVLYEQSHVAQKIAYLYPLEAADHWFNFEIGAIKRGHYGATDESLRAYLDSRSGLSPGEDPILHRGSLKALFFEASLNARIFGSGYLILGIDDGGDWPNPVRSDRIKSLRWIESASHQEIRPYWSGSDFVEFYQLTGYGSQGREAAEIGRQLIHRSRIIDFQGVYLPAMSRRRRAGRGLSVLQGVWRALARANQSMDAAAYLLQTSSLFTYGLKGLSEIKDETIKKLIESRFESIMMSLSVLKGIAHDAETESISFAARQFGGIDALLKIVIDQLALECDVPRFKVLEISDQGGLNGNKGESERFLWSQVLDAWRDRHWRQPLLYLGKVAMLAKDSPTKGRPIRDLQINLPSSHQFTPQEDLDMKSTHLAAMETAQRIGVLNEYEIRMSTYGGSAWSSSVVLDDRVSKTMSEALDPQEELLTETEPDQGFNIPTTLPVDPEAELAGGADQNIDYSPG